MWILTTRNRPDMCQEVLDAVTATGCTTPGMVWCDGCDYPNLRLPYGWVKHAHPEHLNLGEIYRRAWRLFKGASWVGWMSDDCKPLSHEWDIALIEAAGEWGIAYPDDGWKRGKHDDGSNFVTSLICFGGRIFENVEWSLPGQIQMCIDRYWCDVANPLGLLRYCPDVKAEHRHFSNGARPRDATDTREFKGTHFPKHDRRILDAWRSTERDALIERIRGQI